MGGLPPTVPAGKMARSLSVPFGSCPPLGQCLSSFSSWVGATAGSSSCSILVLFIFTCVLPMFLFIFQLTYVFSMLSILVEHLEAERSAAKAEHPRSAAPVALRCIDGSVFSFAGGASSDASNCKARRMDPWWRGSCWGSPAWACPPVHEISRFLNGWGYPQIIHLWGSQI